MRGRAESARIEQGRKLLRDEFSCADWHQFRQKDEEAGAPDLAGWGSREWRVGVISNPAHPRFRKDGSLNPAQTGLLADRLREDRYRAPAREWSSSFHPSGAGRRRPWSQPSSPRRDSGRAK